MFFRRYQREISVAIAYAALLLLLAALAPRFFQGDKLRSILVSAAPVLIAAMGMTMVILTRQIDISIGSQFSLCGIVFGLLVQAGWPMPAAVGGTLLLGGLFGAVNGSLVAILGLPSIVVTLATMVILRETLRWWREGEFVKDLPDHFQWLGLGQDAGQWLVVLVAVGVFVALGWGLRNLAGGRALFATGSNPEAAFLAGLRPTRVTLTAFIAMGLLASLAAMVNAIRFADVDPIAGSGLEMQVIAAVVVGGVAITGGRGTAAGPLLGVLLLATIGPALVFLGAQPYWEKSLQGGIILAAVLFDALAAPRGAHG